MREGMNCFIPEGMKGGFSDVERRMLASRPENPVRLHEDTSEWSEIFTTLVLTHHVPIAQPG